LAQDEDRLPAPASLVELLFGCAPPALLLRAIARPDEQDEHVALGDAVEQRTLRARRSRADGLRAHRVRAEALNSGPRAARMSSKPLWIELMNTVCISEHRRSHDRSSQRCATFRRVGDGENTVEAREESMRT
jgi:hypothetical protein